MYKNQEISHKPSTWEGQKQARGDVSSHSTQLVGGSSCHRALQVLKPTWAHRRAGHAAARGCSHRVLIWPQQQILCVYIYKIQTYDEFR